MRNVQVAIVIPCYNTSSACVSVITQALATGAEVLVVDDGSTDDTPAHIAGTGVRCIRLPVNAGKGAALKAGIEEVLRGRDGLLGGTFDYILTMDGDGQHDALEIPRFIELGTRERADLVIGVRNVQLMPPKSKVGNYISRVLFYLGTGRYVADTQSGFRLLSVALAKVLLDAVAWRRYETEAEILSKAVTLGFRVATVEIPTIYFDGNRRTHFDPLWDSMRVIAVLSRYALSSLAVTAVDISAFVLVLPYTGGNVVTANVLARAVAVVAHFVLSRAYVFRAGGSFAAAQLVRYLAAVLANLTLTTWLLLLIQRAGADALTAKIAAQLIGFTFSFFLLDRFVFRRAPGGRTNWEEYYQKPFATARWSRAIMGRTLVEFIRGHAPAREALSVLELGGGNSCFLDTLMDALPIRSYTLLDNSPEGMRLARERFAHYGERVSFVMDDAFEAPLERTFDVVFSVGLIEHFDDTAMARLVGLHRRWAKDDGAVIIAVPTPTIFYRIVRTAAEVIGIWKFPDETPVPRAKLAALMRTQGMDVRAERTLWSQILTQAIIAARPTGPT